MFTLVFMRVDAIPLTSSFQQPTYWYNNTLFVLHWMRWVRSLLLLSFSNVFIGFISLKILLNVFCNIKRSLNRGKYSHNHKIIIALMLLWYVSCHSSPMTCKKSYHYFVCNFSMLWTCGLNIQKDKTLRLLLLWLELLECA